MVDYRFFSGYEECIQIFLRNDSLVRFSLVWLSWLTPESNAKHLHTRAICCVHYRPVTRGKLCMEVKVFVMSATAKMLTDVSPRIAILSNRPAPSYTT